MRVIARYGERCAVITHSGRCRELGPVLEVHHLDEDVTNNSWTNLIPVCVEHHRQITMGTEHELAPPSPVLPPVPGGYPPGGVG